MKAIFAVLFMMLALVASPSYLGATLAVKPTSTPTALPAPIDQKRRDWDPVKDLYYRNAPLTFSPTVTPGPLKTPQPKPTQTPVQGVR